MISFLRPYREPSTTLSSSSRSTMPTSIVEEKMNEQMSRNTLSTATTSTSTAVPLVSNAAHIETTAKSTNNTSNNAPSTSSAANAASTSAAVKSLSNGTGTGRGGLDSRMKRAPPARTSALPPPGSKSQTSVVQQQQASSLHLAASQIDSSMSTLNLLHAGRATPFANGYVKCFKDYSLVVTNNDASTAYGPICKITCKTTKERNKLLWDKYVGGNVVNVSICAKYVLIATADGSLHFFNINTGIAILPTMKLITPAIQSAFVSIPCFSYIHITFSEYMRVFSFPFSSIRAECQQ